MPDNTKYFPREPRGLDHATDEEEAEEERILLEALTKARVELGDRHPLVREALKLIRARERARARLGQQQDALTQEVMRVSGPAAVPLEQRTKRAQRAYKARQANPEQVRAQKQRRRALLAGAEGTHTDDDIKAQYARQRGKCFYCKTKLGRDYHVDHVVPLARGGSNGPENIVVACPTCNLRKNAKHPMDFSGRMF